ncbi:MAG: aryl-sulfate sulfotransferase [Saprospiraceae bacterium]|nr:aryl-sulfate sulfotransferase [Saprospiraceae bacterium]HMX88145.1 aryl-sulfate sulfotransferase [Saprospiraceae bacterium]HMZ38888.1 aryl-sulfate sulfotransferase [Saprospiraceae bacterium]HNA64871.1 aryl-sulfate sulfotransferase [Saprospiraceae bacterium]HNB31877.1 aryl-sulfate sulfotransferase [Saprospiraceae bacterium]
MILAFVTAIFLFSINAQAQNTVGLIQYETGNTEGYILFSPISSTKTYLIDKCGKKINDWSSNYRPGLSVSLLSNGDLFRTGLVNSSYFGTGGGKGGILERFSWAGQLRWTYKISDSLQCQHHDAMVLPNGNILAIVWERISLSQATQAGKNPSVSTQLNNQELWSEKIIELKPSGSDQAVIVWQWRAWDHLVQEFDQTKSNFGTVRQHPELIDVNYVVQGPPSNSDWLHFNSIDFDTLNNQIIVSSHNFQEFWIIDHSTTLTQASGHTGGRFGKGGDLLYRWGNPVSYQRGTISDQKLFKQHHAHFIPSGFQNAGKVLVFNNGVNRPGGNYSSVDIIDIFRAGFPYTINSSSPFLPEKVDWSYSAPIPSMFYATNIGGALALPFGALLITDGPSGEFFEIDSTGKIVWEYINPVNATGPVTQGTKPTQNTVFRAEFYPLTFSAFNGIDLTPKKEIEINPTPPSSCTLLNDIENQNFIGFELFPNPAETEQKVMIRYHMNKEVKFSIMNELGQEVYSTSISIVNQPANIVLPQLRSGVYYVRLYHGEGSAIKKITIF